MIGADGTRRRALGILLIAVAASSWGTWPLILRRVDTPAALQSAIVMAVMTLVSLPVMLRDRVPVKATLSQWLAVVWLGVSDALNIVFFFGAYQRTSVAIAVLTHYLTPIFVAIVAPLVLRESVRGRTFVAVGISFVGLFLLLEPWRAGLSSRDAVGAALGAGSAVFYASNVIVNKRLAPAFSGSELMFFHGLVSVPLLCALVPAGAWGTVSTSALVTLLAGAAGPGALAGLFFVWGLRRVQASHASVLALLEPFVAVVLAAAILGQILGLAPLAGGALILIGALLVVTGRDGGVKGRSDPPSGPLLPEMS